jgi:hypothetical protein
MCGEQDVIEEQTKKKKADSWGDSVETGPRTEIGKESDVNPHDTGLAWVAMLQNRVAIAPLPVRMKGRSNHQDRFCEHL